MNTASKLKAAVAAAAAPQTGTLQAMQAYAEERRTAAQAVSTRAVSFARLLRRIGLSTVAALLLLALFLATQGSGEYSVSIGMLSVAVSVACMTFAIYEVIETQARSIVDLLDTAALSMPLQSHTGKLHSAR